MNVIEYFKENQEKFISLFGFAMVFILGFFSGYYYLLDQVDKRGVVITEPNADCAELFNPVAVTDVINNSENTGRPDNTVTSAETKVKSFVASKNSTLFHRSGCSFASKIKEENKVWFSFADEAQSEGYKPHSCVSEQ